MLPLKVVLIVVNSLKIIKLIIFSLPFVIPFNPLTTNSDHINAFMDNDNRVTKLFLYRGNNVPLNIFCLKNLVELTINEIEFVNGEYI